MKLTLALYFESDSLRGLRLIKTQFRVIGGGQENAEREAVEAGQPTPPGVSRHPFHFSWTGKTKSVRGFAILCLRHVLARRENFVLDGKVSQFARSFAEVARRTDDGKSDWLRAIVCVGEFDQDQGTRLLFNYASDYSYVGFEADKWRGAGFHFFLDETEITENTTRLTELADAIEHGRALTSTPPDTAVTHGSGAPPPPDPATFAAYRAKLIELCRFVPLRGISRQEKREMADVQRTAADPDRRLELERIYIELNSTQRREAKRGENEAQPERSQGEPEFIPALALVEKYRHVVLHGGPGSGKSTFFRFFILGLAHIGLGDDEKWRERLPGWTPLVPVRVELRHFAKYLRDSGEATTPAGHLWDFLKAGIYALADVAPIEAALRHGHAIVFLDGLDEVPTAPAKLRVRDGIELFARSYPASRIVVTCRTRSYDAELGPDTLHLHDANRREWPAVELAPLEEKKQIPSFIERWYEALAEQEITELNPPDPEKLRATRKARADALKEAVRGDALAKLAPNPLLLTGIAHLHSERDSMKLPENRAELFADIIDLMLYRWVARAADDDQHASLARLIEEIPKFRAADFLHTLAGLAFATFRGAHETAEISENDLLKTLRKLHPSPELSKQMEWAGKVMEFIQFRAGLLTAPDGSTYAFPHRLFHEYLAALHLTLEDDSEEKIASIVTADGNWDEVVRLAAGNQVFVENRTKDARDIAVALCQPAEAARKANQSPDELAWRKVALAADIVWETDPDRLLRIPNGDQCCEQVRQLSTALLEAGALPPRERARVGVTLGRLGDPRPGVGVFGEGQKLPSFAWCGAAGEIQDAKPADWPAKAFPPRKKFLIGEPKGREVRAYSSLIQFACTRLTQPFVIAKFPVTVAQFQCFEDAGGYAREELWTSDDRRRRSANDVTRRKENQDVFQSPNHPCVGVSWYEARAFCTWLDSAEIRPQLLAAIGMPESWHFRLPSEAQWELAARWNRRKKQADDRLFPWGGESEPDELSARCNWVGAGIGHTSAVGMFPKGNGECGAADLSGNVWEWCQTKWIDPDDKNLQNRYNDRMLDDDNGENSRVLRGGSWVGVGPRLLRSSLRVSDGPDVRNVSFGFRVVCVMGGSAGG